MPCHTCGASFAGLAPGKTGEAGIWRFWRWYCSVECAPDVAAAAMNQAAAVVPARRGDGKGQGAR